MFLKEELELLDSMLSEAKFSIKRKKRLKPSDRMKNKKYYRRNKSKIKKKNRKWNRSAKGRKWKRLSSMFKKRTKKRKGRIRRSVRL